MCEKIVTADPQLTFLLMECNEISRTKYKILEKQATKHHHTHTHIERDAHVELIISILHETKKKRDINEAKKKKHQKFLLSNSMLIKLILLGRCDCARETNKAFNIKQNHKICNVCCKLLVINFK